MPSDRTAPAAIRFILATGAYVADGDPNDLTLLTDLDRALATAWHTAINGLRASRYTDDDLAQALGLHRHTVSRRWPPQTPRPTGAAAWRR